MSKTCRVTMWPDKIVTLEDTEYIDLKRQGVVIEGSEQDEETEVAAEDDTPPSSQDVTATGAETADSGNNK